jgi:O-acetyl-ADP-ribose deacetylase (regulator of RNase III)
MRIVEGDLLDADEQYICHQCNCITTRAAGLAAKIHSRFPHADVYSPRGGRDTPGGIIISGNGGDERLVISMMAQVYPGGPKFPGDLGGDREAMFGRCLDEIAALAGMESLAFPWGIGCGMAGGSWERYEKMLVEFDGRVSALVSIYRISGRG